MAFSMVAGSKGEKAAVVVTSYVTGVGIALLDKKKPTWTTPVTAVVTAVGAGAMLMGKGLVATIGEGVAAGGAALLGAATPGWFNTAAAGASARRVGTPAHMTTRVDARQTQNITPLS
jgi:hypothetical protein